MGIWKSQVWCKRLEERDGTEKKKKKKKKEKKKKKKKKGLPWRRSV